MLIQFRVENHRSLRDEQVLSLVAASEKTDEHVLRIDGLGEALIPVAAIYGANASGKSNVLAALGFMRSAIVDSQRRWEIDGTPQEPFRLSSKVSEPSLYEVDVVVDGVRFRYGFRLSSSRVEEEWLFTWPNGRKAMWLERDGDQFTFGKTLHGENEAIRNLTRSNSLFLSAAAQNNHPGLLPLVRYFAGWQFSMARGQDGFSPRAIAHRLRTDAGTAQRASIVKLLKAADAGIQDVRVDSQAAIDVAYDAMASADGELLAASTMVFVRAMLQNPGAGLKYHSTGGIHFRHGSSDGEHAWLPLTAESAGTVALLELAPHIVDALHSGGLICIDELEASLHPSLAMRIVEMFNDPKQNPKNAQLLFATHDTNLLGTVLGKSVLRRDQVWFTEKDEGGGTHLYPLTDFHPRKDENLERGYLQGRYGAIPFLGELVKVVGGGMSSSGAPARGSTDQAAGGVSPAEVPHPRGLRRQED